MILTTGANETTPPEKQEWFYRWRLLTFFPSHFCCVSQHTLKSMEYSRRQADTGGELNRAVEEP